jgi:hypothetical protein
LHVQWVVILVAGALRIAEIVPGVDNITLRVRCDNYGFIDKFAGRASVGAVHASHAFPVIVLIGRASRVAHAGN